MIRTLMAALLGVTALAGSGAAWAAPDAIWRNGRVLTVDKDFSVAEAIAVEDGKIVGVGTWTDVGKLAGPQTKVIDLGGKTVTPGFYDNHGHLSGPLQEWKHGGWIGKLDDWIADADTPAKFAAAVRRQAKVLPKGAWIVGELAREDWPNSSLPTLKELDAMAPDNPMAMARGPHTLLVNSMGLAAAKIGPTTKPGGGEILRDANGVPTGKITEAARRLIWDVLPQEARARGSRDLIYMFSDKSPFTPEQVKADWLTMLRQLVPLGYTSLNIAGIRPAEFAMVEDIYRQHGDELPRLTLQLRLWPGFDRHDDPAEGLRVTLAELDAFDKARAVSHPKLRVGAVKMSIDGGLSAPVMWTTREYENRPGFHGEERISPESFYAVSKRAKQLGWNLGIHAMGDGAVVMVVDQLEKIYAEVPGTDRRDYLHHVAAPPPPATVKKMADLKIGVASQPGFLLSLGSYADEALWPEDEPHQDASRSLMNAGIKVSYGSDLGPYGPIPALYAAVTRRNWEGKVQGADEKVTPREAIEMHTLAPAWFNFEEKERGTLEVGKVADFVVLSADPTAVDPEKIDQIRVVKTVIAGREVYAAK